MSDKHELEQNDSLKEYYKEIGDGMEPPAELVKAAKTGVFLNPGAKPSTHVWKFTKAVVCYALGIALFLGGIALLPRLFERGSPAGPQGTTTTATTTLTDGTDFFALPEDVRAEVEAAYVKHFGLRSFPDWLETGGDIHYYGIYNGCVVFYHSSDLTAVESRDIGGYVFSNGNRFTLMAYKDGELLDLEDAYAEGWMTKEEIGKIHQKHLERNDRDADEILQNAMRKVYAKQFDVNEEGISIRLVKNLSEGCGVFVDVAGTDYGKTATVETVYGLTFRYPDSQRMLFYHGTRYYTLADAAKQGCLSSHNVRKLYLEHHAEALQKLEKLICVATEWDTFTSGKVVFTVHPEFNAYQYTKDDFPYMSLISIEELTPADPDHPEQGKTLLLTMKYDSKKSTVHYVEYLENEPDVYSAIPYGYGQTPDEPDPPVTEPAPPVTEPVDDREYCVKQFERGLGKKIEINRDLTAEEINRVKAFFGEKDAELALACTYVPFYNPKKISLVELMYASNIKEEFPDNPYQNDGSMMTVARIKSVVKRYFGYEVPESMFKALLLEGVEYFPDLDAYGFPHTDASGFVPSDPMYGYLLEDGRWLVHLCSFDAEGDHVMVLLNPRHDGFYIEAGQRVYQWDIPTE